jgi:predicted transcriptional regulator YheO
MFEEQHLPQVFELLSRVARAIVATVGVQCEVVVHDLRNPDHTLIAISGNLTDRTVGAPVPDTEFLPRNLATFQDDIIRQPARTPRGRELISSTVWVRNTAGAIVGAICINMDFNDLRHARDLLNRALADVETPPGAEVLETFATSPQDFVEIALRGAIRKVGKPLHRLNRQDKIAIIAALEQAEVFRFSQSIEIVMEQLGISRASIYAYLKEVRGETEVHAG